MKGVEIFCASQASTAICVSMDPGTSSTIQLGGRAIDRHNPIIRDEKRIARTVPTPPCSSHQSPINPIPCHQLQKTHKTSSKSKGKNKNSSNDQNKKKKEASFSRAQEDQNDGIKKSVFKPSDFITRSCVKPGGLITPPGSCRHLLEGSPYFDGLRDYELGSDWVSGEAKKSAEDTKEEEASHKVEKINALNQDKVLVEHKNNQIIDQHESSRKNPSSSSISGSSSSNQVVVLRVSLHCKGCEGKVRKHLSKMQGVTSFNIDRAAKKVTVVGDVTPLSVLASVSKVKNAQFWPSAPPAVSSSAASAGLKELKR